MVICEKKSGQGRQGAGKTTLKAPPLYSYASALLMDLYAAPPAPPSSRPRTFLINLNLVKIVVVAPCTPDLTLETSWCNYLQFLPRPTQLRPAALLGGGDDRRSHLTSPHLTSPHLTVRSSGGPRGQHTVYTHTHTHYFLHKT